jgi:hypothetical protein
MKLDGNVLNQPKKPSRPISDHTYNEIKQPFLPNNQIQTNGHNGPAGGVLERAMQFNGALRDRVFSWYRGANHTGREPVQEQTTSTQVLSTSENGESDQKVSDEIRFSYSILWNQSFRIPQQMKKRKKRKKKPRENFLLMIHSKIFFYDVDLNHRIQPQLVELVLSFHILIPLLNDYPFEQYQIKKFMFLLYHRLRHLYHQLHHQFVVFLV